MGNLAIKVPRLVPKLVRGVIKFKVGTPSPLYAHYMVTGRCNMRCVFCDWWKMNVHELPTNEALSVIDEVCKLGAPFFHLSGGEPLLRKDLIILAKRAASHGCTVGMSTNATLLKNSNVSEIADVFDYVVVSLDGPREIHDSHRGVKGTFDKAIEGIKLLKDLRVRVGVNTILAPWNIEILPEFIEWLQGFADSLTIQPIHPYPPPAQNTPSPEAVSNIVDYLLKLKNKHPSFFAELSTDFIKGFKPFFEGKLPKLCHAGELYIAINPEGKLLACASRTDIVLGDALTHSASDLLREKTKNPEWLKVSTCKGCWLTCSAQSSITLQRPIRGALSLVGIPF
jgi:MoaA/NifB/PqqE/SkfB family radical SAM enzyme